MPIWSRIVNAFRGDSVNREIDEELESHLEDARAAGRDTKEAQRALGSALQLREASRDVRLASWLDSLRADAVVGWRRLLKTKATSAAAILSLALGMAVVFPVFGYVAAPLFVIGLVLLIVAVVLAMVELEHALDPILLETRFITELGHDFES